MVFSDELVELARKEKDVKDRIWVLITGGNDKNIRISKGDLEKLNKILGFKLETKEIDTILFWGKHGYKKEFKQIQGDWLDKYTENNTKAENRDGKNHSESLETKANTEFTVEQSILNIDLGYDEFCDLFDRCERNNKKRISKRVNISNIE
ncbi:hypothetical protein FG386_001314 [Cryptosporidium ryanae]|uniref:uncharacterized protein n=1 Tax=Cryptosporidium ryanae TaxID=515981 RepID=UPI00351A1A5B|nr:hypothetical protein FG386_001314 [Cryptosporidium ryanae]